MSFEALTPEKYLEAVEALAAAGGSKRAAAAAIGIQRSTLSKRLERGVELGYHMSTGARDLMQAAKLNGVEVRGGWQAVLDADGQKIANLQFSVPRPVVAAEDMLDRIRAAFEDLPPSVPVRPPEAVVEDSLAFLPHCDVHVGMVVTSAQNGGRPYNRKLAQQRFQMGVSSCNAFALPSHTALIVNMGDLLHSNDDTDRTPRSHHKLKTEGTHFENLLLAVQLTVYKIDLALQRHQNVIYRGIPGNHDPNIPGPLSIALHAHYRNEPRVEIILKEDEFWQMNWGNVFLSGHHGHGRKAKDVCPILPGKYPKQWGKATEWHHFTAHLHNYRSETIGSVRHHQLPAVCSIDTHAAWAPYLDTSGMVAMVFNKKGGYTPSIQLTV